MPDQRSSSTVASSPAAVPAVPSTVGVAVSTVAPAAGGSPRPPEQWCRSGAGVESTVKVPARWCRSRYPGLAGLDGVAAVGQRRARLHAPGAAAHRGRECRRAASRWSSRPGRAAPRPGRCRSPCPESSGRPVRRVGAVASERSPTTRGATLPPPITSATVRTLMLRSGWLSSQVRNASMVRSVDRPVPGHAGVVRRGARGSRSGGRAWAASCRRT